MPSKTAMLNVLYALAALAVINRIPQARRIISGA